jgi:hypothetical protein
MSSSASYINHDINHDVDDDIDTNGDAESGWGSQLNTSELNDNLAVRRDQAAHFHWKRQIEEGIRVLQARPGPQEGKENFARFF